MHDFPKPPINSARLGLDVLRSELNRSILLGLEDRSMSRGELKRWLVLSSATALHSHLGELIALGVIERDDTGGVPPVVTYELTPSGHSLVAVIRSVEAWLLRHPHRPLEPTSPLGWRAFAAMADAWESSLFQRLVLDGRSEKELLTAMVAVNDEKLTRELHRLLGAGLLEETDSAGSGSACDYALTHWGRLAISVLSAAARWERIFLPDRAAPLTLFDVVMAFLSTLPLLRSGLPEAGTCVFTIELDPVEPSGLRAGAVWARVEDGNVNDCGAGKAPGPPEAWVRGSVDGYFAAILDGRLTAVQLGGAEELAASLLQGLRSELYASDISERDAFHAVRLRTVATAK